MFVFISARLVPTPEPDGKDKLDDGGISVKFDKSGVTVVEAQKNGKSSRRNRRNRHRISSFLRAIFRRR